ncbi:CHAT domain-containing protein [Micromonospora echinospora]|uniref:CHAT domain-containing tetratricopeptide repeat protein n=1 Tax=Micromonospora echinospora TaxID=1877 RepID=UPI003A899836
MRDDVLSTLVAELEAVAAADDWSLLLRPRAVEAVRALESWLAEEGTRDLQVHYLLGLTHWYRVDVLEADEREAEIVRALEFLVICYEDGVERLPEPLLPLLANGAEPVAVEQLRRALASTDHNLLEWSVRLCRRILSDTPDDHPHRLMRMSNLAGALVERSERNDDAGDAGLAIDLMTTVLHETPEPDCGDWFNLALAHSTRFRQRHDPADLDTAVTHIRTGLTVASSPVHTVRGLTQLGHTLRERAEHTDNPADLNDALDCLRTAERQADEHHPKPDKIHSGLAACLLLRAQWTNDVADVDAALAEFDRALALTPEGRPGRASLLAHRDAAERTKEQVQNNSEIMTLMLERIPPVPGPVPGQDGDPVKLLTAIGGLLRRRAATTGKATDLDLAIAYYEAALGSAGPDHPRRADVLSLLGTALSARAGRRGNDAAGQTAGRTATVVPPDAVSPDPTPSPGNDHSRDRRLDLDRAVDLLTEVVNSTAPDDPDRAGRLALLTRVLHRRYVARRERSDLAAAIDHARQALDADPDDPDDQAHLGTVLESWARRFDDSTAEEAVTRLEQAVTATPVGDPEHPARLNALGTALLTRYEAHGRLADLNAAIERLAEAVHHHPGDDAERGRFLAEFAGALLYRFARTAETFDLETACGHHYTAFRLTPTAHRSWPARAAELGNALRIYHDRTHQAEYLDAALELLTNAVAVDPTTTAHRNSLGIALRRRYDARRDPADLDAAVEQFEAVVAGCTPNSLSHRQALANLAITRSARADVATADLDRAVADLRTALDGLPPIHPFRGSAASSLAAILQERALRTGSEADREEAVRRGIEAWETPTADSDTRVVAALVAARLLASRDPDRAADLAEAAVRELPGIASSYPYQADRLYMVSRLAGSAGIGARLVLGADAGTPAERAARALQVLEDGRAVFLGHALGVRGDLSELAHAEPDLVRRFLALRRQVEDEKGDGLPPIGTDEVAAEANRRERAARAQRRRSAELSDLTEQIRTRVVTFGTPPTAIQMRAQAQEGAIVALNVTPLGSDALLLTADGVVPVELPALTRQAVTDQVHAFRAALKAATVDDLDDRLAAQDVLTATLRWLWDGVAEPVLTALGHVRQHEGDQPWPRLWWMPGGALSMLPLHAAGYHTDPATDPGRRTVMDRVVSSYTPSVRALRHAREQARRAGAASVAEEALLVAMPTTPDLPGGAPLHHALDEVERVRRHFRDTTMLCVPEAAPAVAGPPTRAEVLARLPTTAVAHFACHGVADDVDPSLSRLLLQDHARTPLTVADLVPLALDGNRLAYLSACRTASGPIGALADEAVHLATAFQIAGYPQVVGSLWEIDDRVAVVLADAFYAGLRTTSGELDVDRSAVSLHHAVRGLRDGTDLPGRYDRIANPYLWAAFLHAGA